MNFAKTLVLTCAALGLSVAAHAQDIVVNGSTTVLPVMQKAAESFMAANPDIKLVISGGGSGNGIKALLDGLANIAMSSRDIKGSEKELAAKKGINPVRTAVAVDALVPVVNPKNPITELSLSQLKDIYTGKITNWKEVGGEDAKIVVYSRETSSGTYEFFKESVLHNKNYMSSILSMPATGAIIQSVRQTKGAIGTGIPQSLRQGRSRFVRRRQEIRHSLDRECHPERIPCSASALLLLRQGKRKGRPAVSGIP